MTYRSELVQVAAVCLAAAQVEEVDTTSLTPNAEGLRGRFSLEGLLNEVRKERQFQEVKWGTRHGEDARPQFWLLIVLEEIGEVAEEIQKAAAGSLPGFVADAVALGAKARALLELR